MLRTPVWDAVPSLRLTHLERKTDNTPHLLFSAAGRLLPRRIAHAPADRTLQIEDGDVVAPVVAGS